MKTTLIVIQNEADHADAKKLIEKLMGSSERGLDTQTGLEHDDGAQTP